MNVSKRSADLTRSARIAWTAPVALVLGGCHGWEWQAKDRFAATYHCPKDQVTLHGRGDASPIEATGCGHRAEYTCSTPPCRSAEDFAVESASDAWSCPKERISIETLQVPTPQPQPPPDVAADPARLAIWQKNDGAPSPTRAFSASGCGRKGTVTCTIRFDTSVVEGTEFTDAAWRCYTGSPLERMAEVHDALLHVAAQARLGNGQFACLGPVVEAVRPDSSAGKAGLMAEDVILEVDHQPIGDDRATAGNRIYNLIHVPGFHLLHVRRGKTTLDLRIEESPQPGPAAPAPSGSGQP